MMNAEHTPPIKLEPPGNGLPAIERFIAKRLISWKNRRTTVIQSSRLFAEEQAKILSLAHALTDEQGARQVLIKRLQGLEDSSRYWSVFMTMDHLRIVNLGTLRIIETLARDQLPERVVSTAEVKPSAATKADIIREFTQACEQYQQGVSAIGGTLRTRLKWAHPWFGPFDAAEWHFMIAFHMGLHRQQIESIRKGLQ